jgi:nitronate monooxygenase
MSLTLSSGWSRSFGLSVPIVSAPMGGAAGGELATAVSRAGGLGTIGIGSAGSGELLEREASIARRAGVDFGVGLLAWAVERDPTLLEVAIAARPRLIAVSFGDPAGWPDVVRDAGIATATQVYDAITARRAEEAGIDLLVARGSEGGGHGVNGLAALPLLHEVLDTVTVPVLAAGGIASGRGLAAVLSAGAAGAWMGTCFAACSESLLPAQARERMIAATGSETVYTRDFDIAAGYPWPVLYGERVLANDFSRRWATREGETDSDRGRAELAAAQECGDYSVLPINAGQGVGFVREVQPVAEVIRQLNEQAIDALEHRGEARGSEDSDRQRTAKPAKMA